MSQTECSQLNLQTLKALVLMGTQNHVSQVMNALLQIWMTGWPQRVKQMEQSGQLVPMMRRLLPQLDQAADLRAAAENSHLAMHEILQMAELLNHPTIRQDGLSAEKIY